MRIPFDIQVKNLESSLSSAERLIRDAVDLFIGARKDLSEAERMWLARAFLSHTPPDRNPGPSMSVDDGDAP